MSSQGPPSQFFQRPKPPAHIPIPKLKMSGRGSRKNKPGGGAAPDGGAGRSGGPEHGGREKGHWFGMGEDWRTYAVVVVSAIILIGFAVKYVTTSFRQLDHGKAISEMALLGAALEHLAQSPGGLRLAPEARSDAAVLKILGELAKGGQPLRNPAGEITGAHPPASGARPLFLVDTPKRSVLGASFHFIPPDAGAQTATDGKDSGDAKAGAGAQTSADSPTSATAQTIPTIEVAGFGKLHPPGADGRWIFEGDLTHVPRDIVIGGEELAVKIKRGDGKAQNINIFKPTPPSPASPDSVSSQSPPPPTRLKNSSGS